MSSKVQNAEDSFVSTDEGNISMTTESKRQSIASAPSAIDAVRKRVFVYTSSKPTQKMLIEAIGIVAGSEEKGASAAAITKWIIGNYAVLDVDRVKMDVKRAITKALEKGIIERAARSKGSLGANGSFVLAKKDKKRIPLGKENKKPQKSAVKKQEEAAS